MMWVGSRNLPAATEGGNTFFSLAIEEHMLMSTCITEWLQVPSKVEELRLVINDMNNTRSDIIDDVIMTFESPEMTPRKELNSF